MVRVVLPALRSAGGRWIAAAISDEDREVAAARPRGWDEGNFILQLLRLPQEAHRGHYREVSTRYLGPLFHYLFRLPSFPVFDADFREAWAGYIEINRLFGRALVEAPEPGPVLINDFHLMSVARAIREGSGSADRPLLYFHHVPWCDPEYFSLLPTDIADDMLISLLAHDVVGFNASRWASNFLECCRVRGVGRVRQDGIVLWDGRRVRVVTAPAPVEGEAARAKAETPRARANFARFEGERGGRWALVRVDRADPWKNVLNGFLAFESLLTRRPELASEIWFLALLTPARTWAAEYRAYMRQCLTVARRLNERFRAAGPAARDPVTVDIARREGGDQARAFAGMRVADAILVSSYYDGLNLVAKESAIVSDQHPVLILSRNAGVFEQISDCVLPIDPCDSVGMGHAIERAYRMEAAERVARGERIATLVNRETPKRWLGIQLTAAGVAR